ncbi:MAG TPA: hypothetical protein VM096_10165 [Vicinamibacterales bacterium]|nr:hypothetical protein [Vicinamibacterales bacterium]
MPRERRQLILGAIAVVLLAIAAWSLWPSTPAKTTQVQPPVGTRGVRKGVSTVGGGPVAPVRLDALTASRDEPGQAARNPFRFQPKVIARPPAPPAPTPVIEPPRPTVPTGPPPPPPLPPISLKLIGVLERANGVKWAVLTDGKSPSPMYGKDGDIIDGRYLIVKIGNESIEMTHTNGQGKQVIRLTGQ